MGIYWIYMGDYFARDNSKERQFGDSRANYLGRKSKLDEEKIKYKWEQEEIFEMIKKRARVLVNSKESPLYRANGIGGFRGIDLYGSNLSQSSGYNSSSVGGYGRGGYSGKNAGYNNGRRSYGQRAYGGGGYNGGAYGRGYSSGSGGGKSGLGGRSCC